LGFCARFFWLSGIRGRRVDGDLGRCCGGSRFLVFGAYEAHDIEDEIDGGGESEEEGRENDRGPYAAFLSSPFLVVVT
jgi:hypothetical protein